MKTLRDQERIPEQAERNYAHFVDRWKTRLGKNEVRERLSSAMIE